MPEPDEARVEGLGAEIDINALRVLGVADVEDVQAIVLQFAPEGLDEKELEDETEQRVVEGPVEFGLLGAAAESQTVGDVGGIEVESGKSAGADRFQGGTTEGGPDRGGVFRKD
jgi:hypothetical protein